MAIAGLGALRPAERLRRRSSDSSELWAKRLQRRFFFFFFFSPPLLFRCDVLGAGRPRSVCKGGSRLVDRENRLEAGCRRIWKSPLPESLSVRLSVCRSVGRPRVQTHASVNKCVRSRQRCGARSWVASTCPVNREPSQDAAAGKAP